MASRVALIDDDTELLALVSGWLARGGYETATASEGTSGLRLVNDFRPDLVILDAVVPGMDGWTLCRRIRDSWDIPVIMLSAMASANDRLRAYDCGCDDYVTKPCESEELLARARAILRRGRRNGQSAALMFLDSGRVQLNLDQRQVIVNGQRIYVTPTEYRMLDCLAHGYGRVVTHGELVCAAWGESYDASRHETYVASRDETKVYISYLRRKLGDDGKAPRIIETVRTVGYRLATEGSEN
jgi:DNA-binding response OmpR family regulator